MKMKFVKLLFCIFFGLTWYCLLGEVMISDSFNCFVGTPSFVHVPDVLSKRDCSFVCIVRKCLFFRYEDENCYIDDSASDVQEGGIVGRSFVSFSVSFLGYDKPVSSSSAYNWYSQGIPILFGPRFAVDKAQRTTIFITYNSQHEWMILDLGRSFAIESLVVTLRDGHLNQFSNVKVFLSSEIDFDNFFDNAKMTLFDTQMTQAPSTTVTFTPEDGSPSMCGRYLTISQHKSPNGDQTLDITDMQPIIVNQALFDVDF